MSLARAFYAYPHQKSRLDLRTRLCMRYPCRGSQATPKTPGSHTSHRAFRIPQASPAQPSNHTPRAATRALSSRGLSVGRSHGPLDPEQVRADAIELMRAHAAITPRGWDDQKRRARLHERIDERLDDWLLLTAVKA